MKVKATTAFLMSAAMLMLAGTTLSADNRLRDLRRDDRWDRDRRDDVRDRVRERERREAIARRLFLEQQRREAMERQRYERERARIERERYRNNGYYNNGYGAYGNNGYGAYGNNGYGAYGNNGYGIGRGSGYGTKSYAYQRGYNTGLESGRDDLRRGKPFNPSSHDHYNDGDSGYNSSHGDKGQYIQSYRAGWMAGYRLSYGGRY